MAIEVFDLITQAGDTFGFPCDFPLCAGVIEAGVTVF